MPNQGNQCWGRKKVATVNAVAKPRVSQNAVSLLVAWVSPPVVKLTPGSIESAMLFSFCRGESTAEWYFTINLRFTKSRFTSCTSGSALICSSILLAQPAQPRFWMSYSRTVMAVVPRGCVPVPHQKHDARVHHPKNNGWWCLHGGILPSAAA